MKEWNTTQKAYTVVFPPICGAYVPRPPVDALNPQVGPNPAYTSFSLHICTYDTV